MRLRTPDRVPGDATSTHERAANLRRLRLDEDHDGGVDVETERHENPVLDTAEEQRMHDPDVPELAIPITAGDAPLDVSDVGSRSHSCKAFTVNPFATDGGTQLLPRDRTRRRAVIANNAGATQIGSASAVLQAATTRTTNGNSPVANYLSPYGVGSLGAPLGPVALVVTMIVTAAGGTTFDCKLQESYDGGTTFNDITGGAFTQVIGATGTQVLRIPVSTSVGPLVRALYTITAAGSYTFSISAVVEGTYAGAGLAISNHRSDLDVSNPNSFVLPAGQTFVLTGSDELWAIAPVGATVAASVLQERNSG